MSEHDKVESLLDAEDCVLILMDFQERLLPTIAGKEKTIDNAIKLLKFSKILRLPVVLTEQIKLGSTVPEIKSLMPDEQAILKTTFSCFQSDDFVRKLNSIGREVLILAGIETHICVAQTALQAFPLRVHVVSDATSSRTIENWTIGLNRMREAGAVITSTEMFIFELLRAAGTDEFRATLKLVK
jgi:nicotinamidase-related amidase